jgi:hypothetical protein
MYRRKRVRERGTPLGPPGEMRILLHRRALALAVRSVRTPYPPRYLGGKHLCFQSVQWTKMAMIFRDLDVATRPLPCVVTSCRSHQLAAARLVSLFIFGSKPLSSTASAPFCYYSIDSLPECVLQLLVTWNWVGVFSG